MKNFFVTPKGVGMALLALTVIFASCKKQNDSSQELVTASSQDELSGSNWRVQVKGKTIGFFDSEPDRYSNTSSGIKCRVVGSDPKTSSNAGGPRTELRSTSAEFTSGSGSEHKLSVTMKLVKPSSKVVVGQIFSGQLGSDLGEIIALNRKLVARDKDNNQITLKEDVGTGSFSFTITSNNDGTFLSSNGNTLKITAKVSGCYFKTGAYLINKDNPGTGSAEVFITALNKY